MVYTESEIQAQLEEANARLIRRRHELGIRDDRPVHVREVMAVVIADMVREAEEVH